MVFYRKILSNFPSKSCLEYKLTGFIVGILKIIPKILLRQYLILTLVTSLIPVSANQVYRGFDPVSPLKRYSYMGRIALSDSSGVVEMNSVDTGIDYGIPLPGSNPERRRRIKLEINRIKRYLILYRIEEVQFLMPCARSIQNREEDGVPAALL